MVDYAMDAFRIGLKVSVDGEPCSIIDSQFEKPGKGQAFTRIKLRNLRTQRVWERTYKSGDRLPSADVVEEKMQYLYHDKDLWYFMRLDGSFEQLAASFEAIGNSGQWLQGEEKCQVILWNGQILSVEPPTTVQLAVIDTDPGVRGDTVSNATKPATVQGGAVVRAPLFIEIGDVLKIDTRSGTYLSRT